MSRLVGYIWKIWDLMIFNTKPEKHSHQISELCAAVKKCAFQIFMEEPGLWGPLGALTDLSFGESGLAVKAEGRERSPQMHQQF